MEDTVSTGEPERGPAVGAMLMAVYGTAVYAVFLAVFLYAIGWVEALVVPHTINSGPATSTPAAIVIDLALLSVFAVQHSVMGPGRRSSASGRVSSQPRSNARPSSWPQPRCWR
jgi:methanethiol S-methyltransferase